MRSIRHRVTRLRFIPKAAGLVVLYCGVFLLLVCVQFSRQTSFSLKVGNFVVSGETREAEDGAPYNTSNDAPNGGYLISKFVQAAFGGLLFVLSNTENPPLLVDSEGTQTPLTVDTLKVSADSVLVTLSDGVELSFYAQKSSEADGILISSVLPEQASAMLLPVAAAPLSRMDAAGIVESAGAEYRFNRDALDKNSWHVILTREEPAVLYHAIPPAQDFNPIDWTVRSAMTQAMYEEQVTQWLSGVYAVWGESVSQTADEEVITAFIAEAVRGGAYTSAVAQVPESFRTSSAQTFHSAPFLGRLDAALRTLSAAERADSARLSSQIRDNPDMLLAGTSAFKQWVTSENNNLIDERGLYARGVSPAEITLAETQGILEGRNDWQRYQPGSDNPFDRLVPRALQLISASLVKDALTGNVFSIFNGKADAGFNLRLGLTLAKYSENIGDSPLSGVGRSIVLSILAQTNAAAEIPLTLSLLEDGTIKAEEGAQTANAAHFYPEFAAASYYPHAASLSAAQNGVWAWTASPNVSAVFQNNILDISVSYPVGWTHYLLVRRISPFTKIQLRDVDYRSDPRFEQYNSPGWAYSASEQTLLVKLVHRSEVEHIRVFY